MLSALLAGAAVCTAVRVAAQEQTPLPTPVIEEVLVFGSLVRRPDYSSPSPVFTIDREAILAEGSPSRPAMCWRATLIRWTAALPSYPSVPALSRTGRTFRPASATTCTSVSASRVPSASAGVRNLTDEPLPLLGSNALQSNTNPNLYGVLGPRFHLGVQLRL